MTLFYFALVLGFAAWEGRGLVRARAWRELGAWCFFGTAALVLGAMWCRWPGGWTLAGLLAA